MLDRHRECIEECIVGDLGGGLSDHAIELVDGIDDATQLSDERLDKQRVGGDDGIVLSQSTRGADRVDALADELTVADVVLDEEGAQGCAAGTASLFERWPTRQEVADGGAFLVEPL